VTIIDNVIEDKNIPELLHEISFPVYGFTGNPFGLHVCGLSYGMSGQQISNIGFTYSSPRYTIEEDAIKIDSSPSDSEVFESYGLSAEGYLVEDYLALGNPRLASSSWTIEEVSFEAEIRYWSRPYKVSRFHLKSKQSLLSGHSIGVPLTDLRKLLQSLVVINRHEDLLVQYQDELDQDMARYEDQDE